jgi:hypothetical protein
MDGMHLVNRNPNFDTNISPAESMGFVRGSWFVLDKLIRRRALFFIDQDDEIDQMSWETLSK